jgi:hypothetical protein
MARIGQRAESGQLSDVVDRGAAAAVRASTSCSLWEAYAAGAAATRWHSASVAVNMSIALVNIADGSVIDETTARLDVR